MTGSVGSRARSSSYEKGGGDARHRLAEAAEAGGARRALSCGALARVAAAALVAASALIAGCGSLPANVGKTDSLALPPNPDSPLVKIAAVSSPSPEQTGVRLLPLGAYSLDTRLQLAQRASTSLDVQYYQFENDSTGLLLFHALRDASERGVRVRLLVDDLYTSHSDPTLRGLASFPNVEVRLFNPFCCNRGAGPGGRYTASIFDFGRLNHRMHNKLFIADGVMAVAGGRNIADEYFLRAHDANFVDMDAFVMGAVVRSMAAIFDRYWNSEVVYPIEAVGEPLGDKAARRQAFDAAIATMTPPPVETPSTDLLGYGPLAEEFDAGQLGLEWGTARAFADPPEKLLAMTPKVAFEMSVTNDVMMQVWQAQSDLVLTSPYMIPGEPGMKSFDTLHQHKVKVTVITNSLAATDEPLVHNGYAHYRERMLRAGVDLYELSPTRTQQTKRLGMFGTSLGRLHAKTAVIDKKIIFIGSMNLDPRSASTNTEFGMFIESPALAKELLRVINISKLEGAYRLQIDPKTSKLEWLTIEDDKETVLQAEPESTFWLRVHNMLLGWFVPEQLL
ncbi:MAG TPA: phospholipase D family protein [Caldimonas sp.]|jgi:putative cardiolipin synthase